MEARVEELERQLQSKQNHRSLNDPLGMPHSTVNPTMLIDDLPLNIEEWPLELPPKPLMFHLVDVFFTYYPNSRRIVHRPTFMVQLVANPTSPCFPFIPLLHAICAAAAIYSPLVEATPPPNLHADDIFPGQTLVDRGRNLSFEEQHIILCEYQCRVAAREGGNLLGVIQSCVIGAWWAFSYARWFDFWNMSSFAMRLCVALGLNFADSPHHPLPKKIREKVLIGPPSSNMEVELRRNVFWLTYCLERCHLFSSPWVFDISDEDINQTLPGTLEAFESGLDDGRERQTILSGDLFSTHYSNQDDFTIYVKCAIMLSRAHLFECRQLPNFQSVEDAQNSQSMKDMELMISSLRQSIKKRVDLADQASVSSLSNSFIAATARINTNLANWQDPGCESANKALSASRAILRYTTGLTTTSFNMNLLDVVVCVPWLATGKALVFALEHAPESLALILRAEIRLVRGYLSASGGRTMLFPRQRQSFDKDIVRILGEKEAAKVFDDATVS
ncbi:unnamed protein product [Rhizoctonia solani]|uniref:Xylanolytic transcriptional activator regulatory domain-containing protein n=1 Tax=Rhizoctonia solani TaxID=456999 RepID=A0A8H2XV42_9AGAM|nr:unnamed protein product [Rhizoctonia solani]